LDYSVLLPWFPLQRVQETIQLDRWFLRFPLLALTHVVPGTIFLVMAPLQFLPAIRTNYIRFHRWSGRVILMAGLCFGISGLILGAVFPFNGPVATAAVFTTGTLFLVSLICAFVAIRRGNVARHREWMIRMFSLGVGIAVVRIIATPILLWTTATLTTAAAISFWAGWLLCFAVGEFWIRQTKGAQTIKLIPPACTVENHISG
jgi:uncharacterized membrane protein